MTKDIKDLFTEEVQLPDDIVNQLQANRQIVVKQKQDISSSSNISKRRIVIMFTLVAASIGLCILLMQTPVIAAIKTALGINRDAAVKVVEDQGLSKKMKLSSVQNGREITVTKFVSTQKKFAVDYQFKLDDPKLKALLEKNRDSNSKSDSADFGLFAEGNPQNLFGGVSGYNTYYIKKGIYYGSLIATFVKKKIPKDAKLTFHINELSWSDQDRLKALQEDALAKGLSFWSSKPDITYQGDWQFKITNRPILKTKKYKISKENNVSDVKVISDALQTTIKFKVLKPSPALVSEDGKIPEKSPDIVIYRNGIKIKTNSMIYNLDGGSYTTDIELSALDKSKATYKVQLNEVDPQNNSKSIASFEFK